MRLSLKERLEQLEQIPAEPPITSGFPVTLVIRDAQDRKRLQSLSAIKTLKRRGVPLLKAKRTIEHVMEHGEVVIRVPHVESLDALVEEFAGYGFDVHAVIPPPVDVRLLRERLGLTQEDFALQYGLELDAVRNWEHGRREPNTAAKSYLRVIERMPEEIRAALAGP